MYPWQNPCRAWMKPLPLSSYKVSYQLPAIAPGIGDYVAQVREIKNTEHNLGVSFCSIVIT